MVLCCDRRYSQDKHGYCRRAPTSSRQRWWGRWDQARLTGTSSGFGVRPLRWPWGLFHHVWKLPTAALLPGHKATASFPILCAQRRSWGDHRQLPRGFTEDERMLLCPSCAGQSYSRGCWHPKGGFTVTWEPAQAEEELGARRSRRRVSSDSRVEWHTEDAPSLDLPEKSSVPFGCCPNVPSRGHFHKGR